MEQAGAYIDKLRLSFAEYIERWHRIRARVLEWHDEQVMGYPVSVAATWETTFAQLGENERSLLEVLSWLAPEPIPLVLLEADPLGESIPEPRDTLAGLMGYSLARFDTTGDGVLVHRLVQEITRNRPFSTRKPEPGSWIRRFIEWFAQRHRPKADHTVALKVALESVHSIAPFDAQEVHT